MLRHQLSVLQRQLGPGRVRFTPGDRALLAALLHRLPRDVLKRLHLVVRPDTMLGFRGITDAGRTERGFHAVGNGDPQVRGYSGGWGGAVCETDAPMRCQGFFSPSSGDRVLDLLRDGHDRDGPLAVEGRLLSGHEVSRVERGSRGGRRIGLRPARGCGSRLKGQVAPGSCGSGAVAEVVVDLARDVTFQAADDLLFRQSFFAAAAGVGAGFGVGAQPGDHDPP